MAEQAATPQDKPTSPASPPPTGKTDAATQAASPSSGLATDTAEGQSKTATQADKDPMQDLLDRLARDQPKIAQLDPGLAQTIQTLAQTGADPDRRSQSGFRHQVAYAVQDIERQSVGQIPMAPELRSEMTRLAGAAPGLENERMLALMRATATIEDHAIVRDIRREAADIGRRTDQTAPDIQSRIDTLENRYRLTSRPAEPPPAAEQAEGAARSKPAPPMDPTSGTTRAAAQDRTAADNTGTTARQFGDQGPGRPQNVTYQRSVLDTVLAGMRPSDRGTGAPWEPPPTPMAERLSAFEKTMNEARDERSFARAMKSGRAALDALQGFSNGEGATVMSRINEAARSEPGGISAVLSEMKDGGRFADLRRQLNNALATDLGLAKAYDRAATALERYGADRSNVQDIIGRRPDASAITQRFEKLDAEIGEAAAKTPSRNDGRSMMEDLVQRAAELLQKAVETVKAAFSRSPAPDAGARPSPSMSMGG